MPGIQRFAIGGLYGKWGGLVADEAKSFGDVEVFEPCHLDLVEVDNMGLNERRRE